MSRKTQPSAEDSSLFREAVGEVRPVAHDRVMPYRRKLPTRRHPASTSDDTRLVEGLSDACPDEELESHDTLWFARDGLQQPVLRKLRRGQIAAAAELDLHGLTVAMARPALADFLQHSLHHGYRCVRIIHGKGFGNGRKPVLKNKVNGWLRQVDEVLAFCSARPGDGGSGAVNVLLRRSR